MASLHRISLQYAETNKHDALLPSPDLPRSSIRFPSFMPAYNRSSSCPLSWTGQPQKMDTKACAAAGGLSTADMDTGLRSDLGISYEKLRDLLAAGEWELADEETRRLIIVLAGENAVKRKYVFFSEVQFIPAVDLQTIDRLWRAHSGGRFGYSVQRKIMKIVDGDCTAFFKKVGWMKPLGSESPQFTYRAFPTEFMWENSPSVPEGHLPLTNALRGTQLLKSILSHPAFDFVDENLQAPAVASELFNGDSSSSSSSRQQAQQQQPKKPLSINYSF